ncbi:MAG: GDP-mannose 4,6-dehydratase [Patescibacteria group bacterium]
MAKEKRALITGITGQDGSYLAEFLLKKGYKVFGLERRNSQKHRVNIEHLLHPKEQITLISGDLLDESSLVHALLLSKPDEVYNLAAQAFVHESWKQPIYTGDVTGLGVLRMLEAIRQVNLKIKFYQASTSEMFGGVKESPQNENTPFYPRSPYAVSKTYAHHSTVNHKESYGMFAVGGILFNHESPRRGIEFVTRKITNTAAKIKLGLAKELRLGSLDAERDWGFAGDYVEAMWLMLQQKEPKNYVIATGVSHSVRDFVEAAFGRLGLDWKKYVKIDKQFMRPAEVYRLRGDTSRAKKDLGWKPKVNFKQLVEMMTDSDLENLKKQYKLS